MDASGGALDGSSWGPETPPALSDDRSGPGKQARARAEPLLSQPTRGAIHELLSDTPGLNKSQVGRRVDEDPSLVDFHLDRLIEGEIVVTRPSEKGHAVLCFPRKLIGLWTPENTRILFGRTATRQVGLYIADQPGTTTSVVSDGVDLTPGTVRHHTDLLESYDLLRREVPGRRCLWYPTDELERWALDPGRRYRKPW